MNKSTEGMGLDVSQLQELSRKCRLSIVEMVHKAGAGHPGGSLSAIDLIVGLYGTRLRIDSTNPQWVCADKDS